MAPAISASWPARITLSGEPGAANGASELATINEVIAIGPTDCTMLLPKSA